MRGLFLLVMLASITCSHRGLHALALGFFGNQNTTAEETRKPTKAVVVQSGKRLHSRLQLGGDYTLLDLHPKGKGTFSGTLAGAQAAYEYWSRGHFYLGMTGAWRQGSVYKHHHHRSIVYIDNQERLGVVLGRKKHGTSWTFFTGFGYRYLSQHYKQTAAPSHYDYTDLYCPAGVEMEYTVGPSFIIGVNFTWMPQVYSRVKVNSATRSHHNISKQISNFTLEVPFDFPLKRNQRVHLIIVPFGQYWRDGSGKGKTKAGDHFKIKTNVYNYWGVDLNLAFCF